MLPVPLPGIRSSIRERIARGLNAAEVEEHAAVVSGITHGIVTASKAGRTSGHDRNSSEAVLASIARQLAQAQPSHSKDGSDSPRLERSSSI